MDSFDSGASTGPTATGGADGAEPGVPLLPMRGITKSFFGMPVLDTVDFDVMADEVHAVVGENGAGTSTLMKILGGRGYLIGCDVERYVRDATMTQVYDGASEIQKVVIARHVLAEGGQTTSQSS